MNVVFVAPYFTGNTHRALLSFLNLPGTQVALISHDPLERVPESVRGRIVGHYQVRDSRCLWGQPGIASVWRAWARPWRSTSARRTA